MEIMHIQGNVLDARYSKDFFFLAIEYFLFHVSYFALDSISLGVYVFLQHASGDLHEILTWYLIGKVYEGNNIHNIDILCTYLFTYDVNM